MPHLQALVERVNESANLAVRAGDRTRFIGCVECSQALRVGNREGMVFPAHLASVGKVLLADLPQEKLEALYSEEKWEGRAEARPDLPTLTRELRTVRHRGFAINAGRTETGVTAVGRAIRAPGERAEAALSISLPTVRFSREKLPQLVAALALTARDIELDLAHQFSPNP